jgi:hypothetical protein
MQGLEGGHTAACMVPNPAAEKPSPAAVATAAVGVASAAPSASAGAAPEADRGASGRAAAPLAPANARAARATPRAWSTARAGYAALLMEGPGGMKASSAATHAAMLTYVPASRSQKSTSTAPNSEICVGCARVCVCVCLCVCVCARGGGGERAWLLQGRGVGCCKCVRVGVGSVVGVARYRQRASTAVQGPGSYWLLQQLAMVAASWHPQRQGAAPGSARPVSHTGSCWDRGTRPPPRWGRLTRRTPPWHPLRRPGRQPTSSCHQPSLTSGRETRPSAAWVGRRLAALNAATRSRFGGTTQPHRHGLTLVAAAHMRGVRWCGAVVCLCGGHHMLLSGGASHYTAGARHTQHWTRRHHTRRDARTDDTPSRALGALDRHGCARTDPQQHNEANGHPHGCCRRALVAASIKTH